MSESNFFVSSKPPKFKKIVLSYDAHAKHFIEEKKKMEIKTQPENVFEGFKKNGKLSQNTKTSKTTNKKVKKKSSS